MTIHQLHHFLQGIHHKIQEQDKLAAATGENFNVFKILGVEAYEVGTHSAFLSELLSPQGTHGQGSTFLKLFLASLPAAKDAAFTRQLSEFHAESATVKPEDCIGPVDPACTEGGRIDITLTDNHNKRIFIENKINAGDGKNQLRRYHDYDKKAALLYLTLYGTSPSKHSLGAGKDFYVHVISYEKDILQWLLRCRKESAMLPGIREALTQYIELVRHLTNQTARRTMKEEIKQLIVNNPDYIEAIDASWQSLAELKSEAEQNFRGVIEKKLADQVKPIPVNRELSIEVQCAEDGDGFYIGYQLMDGKENKSNSELGQQYAKQLRAIAPNFTRNAWHLGWHNPVGFSRYIRVANLDKQLLVKFYTRDKELDDFAQRIVDQERDIRNALEKAVFPLEVKAITTET